MASSISISASLMILFTYSCLKYADIFQKNQKIYKIYNRNAVFTIQLHHFFQIDQNSLSELRLQTPKFRHFRIYVVSFNLRALARTGARSCFANKEHKIL